MKIRYADGVQYSDNDGTMMFDRWDPGVCGGWWVVVSGDGGVGGRSW